MDYCSAFWCFALEKFKFKVMSKLGINLVTSTWFFRYMSLGRSEPKTLTGAYPEIFSREVFFENFLYGRGFGIFFLKTLANWKKLPKKGVCAQNPSLNTPLEPELWCLTPTNSNAPFHYFVNTKNVIKLNLDTQTKTDK